MKIKDGYILKEMAGEAVVVPGFDSKGSSFVIELNETGTLLWKLLEGGADHDALTEAMTGGYNVSRDEAEADVMTFVKKLDDAGILEDKD